MIDAKSDYAGGFGANRDPAIFHSSFAPLTKNACATCHQPTKAGDSCQQCHNYHTGELKMLRLKPAETRAATGPADSAGGIAEARLFALVARNTRP